MCKIESKRFFDKGTCAKTPLELYEYARGGCLKRPNLIKQLKKWYNSEIDSNFHGFAAEFVRKAYKFVFLIIRDIVSQLKNSLKRRRGCWYRLISIFWGFLEWIVVEIGVKSGKKRNKSSILHSKIDSIAFSELNKILFSFQSAVELSEIERAIYI